MSHAHKISKTFWGDTLDPRCGRGDRLAYQPQPCAPHGGASVPVRHHPSLTLTFIYLPRGLWSRWTCDSDFAITMSYSVFGCNSGPS